MVVETEAYLTEEDEACHTFSRPSTREFVKRNKPGVAYIYFNYGMHWMLNVLIKGGSRDGLILIHAIEPRRGIALMKKRRGTDDLRHLCSGPGKLTQAFAMDGSMHGRDFFQISGARLLPRHRPVTVEIDRRIGITKSVELDWRFLLADSEFVSVAKKKTRLRAN